jgi:hypothetical protein
MTTNIDNHTDNVLWFLDHHLPVLELPVKELEHPYFNEPLPLAAPQVLQKVVTQMSTAAQIPNSPQTAQQNFVRFIDAIDTFFKKDAPIIEGVAVAAEPFLALTPAGPEYDLVVGAIVGTQKIASASLAVGANLSGAQKMALVISACTPGLSAILASKNVTTGVTAAVSQFAQNVYNMQTGPVTTVAPIPAAGKN